MRISHHFLFILRLQTMSYIIGYVKQWFFKEGESDMLKNQFVNNYFDDGLLFKEDFVVKGRQMPVFLEVFL